MASIQTSIQLHDSMSNVLYGIMDTVNMMAGSMYDMQQSINAGANTSAFDAMQMEIAQTTAAISNMVTMYEQMDAPIDDCITRQDRFNRELQEGTDRSQGLLKTIRNMVGAYIGLQTAGQVINLSDNLAQTTARFNMMDESLKTTDNLMDVIYQSSQNARGDLMETANSVAKLGILAGDAFSSDMEIVAFTEQMNKNFALGGASIQEQTAAMYQLTQAMAAGRLQGDEFRSISENAPLLAQAIENYMQSAGVEGTLKEWSAEGMITAEVIKNSLFSVADETNRRFEELPMTWGQVWIGFKNDAIMAFQPVLEKINDIANSQSFQTFVNGATEAMQVLSVVASDVLDGIAAVSGFIVDNWSMISPIIYGAAAAWGVYTIAVNWATIAEKAGAIATGILIGAKWGLIAVMSVFNIAQAKATAAQWGLNSAMLANPIGLIIMGIAILIAAFYGVIAIINKLTGGAVSATGFIVGAFFQLGSIVINIFRDLVDFVLDIFNIMAKPFIQFANFLGNFAKDPLSATAYAFQDFADGVLGIVEAVASAIDAVFGSDFASGVAGWRAGLKTMTDDYVTSRGFDPAEFYTESDLNLSAEKTFGWKMIDPDAAFDFGYGFGSDIFGTKGESAAEKQQEIIDNIKPPIEDIAENTGKSMNITEEQLKYLRDMAERDTVNRYTTAAITIDMSGMQNSINNGMDIDGVLAGLTDAANEAVNNIAMGVSI